MQGRKVAMHMHVAVVVPGQEGLSLLVPSMASIPPHQAAPDASVYPSTGRLGFVPATEKD